MSKILLPSCSLIIKYFSLIVLNISSPFVSSVPVGSCVSFITLSASFDIKPAFCKLTLDFLLKKLLPIAILLFSLITFVLVKTLLFGGKVVIKDKGNLTSSSLPSILPVNDFSKYFEINSS